MLQDQDRARPPQDRARPPQDRAQPPQDLARPPRWRADFETGDLSQWEGRFTPASLGTGTADITVVRSPVKQGNYAARVEARTEEETGEQQGTSRSELVRSTKVTGNQGFPVNLSSNSSELWTRWSMFIPSSTVSQLPTDCTLGADGCGIIIQQQASAGNGVFELNGIFSLQHNMTVTYADSDMTDQAYEPFWTSPRLEPDRWYTFMIHKKYSKTNTGFVEIYLDGVQQQLCANAACSSMVSRVTGPTIHPDATIYRLHTGMYYNDNTDATGHKHPVIYLDDWIAYANDPRPGSPRPGPTSAPEPTPSPSPSEPTPKYNRDSETGDLSHWEGLHQDTLSRASEVTSPHIHGSYARALEVREGA